MTTGRPADRSGDSDSVLVDIWPDRHPYPNTDGWPSFALVVIPAERSESRDLAQVGTHLARTLNEVPARRLRRRPG